MVGSRFRTPPCPTTRISTPARASSRPTSTRQAEELEAAARTLRSRAGPLHPPAGKAPCRNEAHCRHDGFIAVKFLQAPRPAGASSSQAGAPPTGQVCFSMYRLPTRERDVVQLMQDAIDSDLGRTLYGRRFATLERVFANLRHRAPPFHLAEKAEGGWATESPLPGAQHRETGQTRDEGDDSAGMGEKEAERGGGKPTPRAPWGDPVNDDGAVGPAPSLLRPRAAEKGFFCSCNIEVQGRCLLAPPGAPCSALLISSSKSLIWLMMPISFFPFSVSEYSALGGTSA